MSAKREYTIGGEEIPNHCHNTCEVSFVYSLKVRRQKGVVTCLDKIDSNYVCGERLSSRTARY